jgi:2,4-dienoyl-CoA reductase-like NADH-dependent reductase (Old Yellow Enzyme family)
MEQLENRLRQISEIAGEIRKIVSEEFAIGIKMNCNDYTKKKLFSYGDPVTKRETHQQLRYIHIAHFGSTPRISAN